MVDQHPDWPWSLTLWQSLVELCDAPLPEDYVRLLREYPERLKATLRSEDGSLAEGFVSDVELLADPNDVLSINREARMGAVLAPDGEEFYWPEQLLIIGETGAGDYFCLDTSEEHLGVLQYLHHSTEFEQIAESIGEYVEMLIDTFYGIAGDMDPPDEDDEDQDDEEDSDFEDGSDDFIDEDVEDDDEDDE